MFEYLLTVCLAITLLSNSEGSNISDQRLCYDPKCEEPLSIARTMIKYVTNHDEGLSFLSGVDVTIYSKSAGTKPELWGAEVDGKRGYIPKAMVREIKVIHPESSLKYTVPTDMSYVEEVEEAGVEKLEESGETKQEKPVAVANNGGPSNINSESSIKKTFDVIDGTTFYDDTLGLATSTIHPIETSSIGMDLGSIESTTSFIATASDMSTASMTQSDMAPISPTTMLEKPNEDEISRDAIEGSGMVDSVFNMVSELVSSGELDVLEKNRHPEAKHEKIEDNAHDDGKEMGIAGTLGESNIEPGGKVNDSPPNEAHETIDDEDDNEDDVEDDEEEDDEEDDGNEEDEEYESGGDDENVVNDAGENAEFNYTVHNMGEDLSKRKEETKSEMSTTINETETDMVGSTVSDSSSEKTTSSFNDGENGSSLMKEVGNPDSVGGVIGGINVSTQTAFDVNGTPPPQDMESSTESSVDAALEESLNDLDRVVSDTESNSKVGAGPDGTTSYGMDQHVQHESATVDIETFKGLSDGSDSILKGNTNSGHENESKPPSISDDIVAGGGMESHEASIVPPVTTEATERVYLGSLISGDQSIKLDLNSVTPGITTENPLVAASTVTLDYSEPSVQAEPSSIVSDEFPTYPVHSDAKPSEAMQTEDVPLSELQATKPLASDHKIEPDASLDFKEPESQKDDMVIESPNASDTENLLPVPEESSSGIFSTLFDSLGSGYGFVSSMIFGSGDESIEVMEGQEGSPQGVSHISASKYSDSDHNLNQHSPSEDIHNMAAGGDSVFGRSSNSHCEGNPESVCEELSATLPSNAISSSDAGDQNSEEDHESSSWMGLPNFSIGNDSSGIFNFNVPSYGAVIYSVITGVIVLCFFLGHYFIEGNRRDVILLAKINALEKELTVSSKECLILKEKLKQFEMKSSDFDDSAEVINSMKCELEKVQSEKAHLEKELEATTEAGLEMEHMVSQFLSSQLDSKSLMESIEQLQMQANKQQAKISSLENSLVAKTLENEKLAQELGVTESKVQELEEDLKLVSENLHQRDEEHSQRYMELKELSESQHNKYLEDIKNKTIETEMALTRCKSLETTLTEMKEILAVKENEISVLQECLQQLKLSNGDDPDKAEDQLKDILNFGKLKADLTAVTKERDNFKEKFHGEEDARKLLEDHVKVIREEVEKLRKCHEAAEREKVEAQTRLEVLSSYFKEKETQLQKELGNKEALWIQKHTDASTVMQRMKSLEEEVENYKKVEDISKPHVTDCVNLKEGKEITTTHPMKECKEENFSKPNVIVESPTEKFTKETVGETSEKKGSQNDTLKKEILDQERGYKSQLATVEKKAHENWVAARQAERKLDESKQEASQLRNRLTMADKTNPTSTSQNGDDSKPNLRRKKFSKIRRFWSTLECAPSESHTQTK